MSSVLALTRWLPARRRRIQPGHWPRLAGVSALLLFLSAPATAQVPAIKRYTSADGLSHEQVARVRLDSRGFLWLGTYDGVTQFDGQRFTTYTTRDGLPDPLVNDVYEDRQGRLWIATNGGGAAVLRPVAPPGEPTRLFDVFPFGAGRPANRVNAFAETADGTLWAATDVGLFKLVPQPEPAFARVPLPAPAPPSLIILDVAADKARDRLWMATSIGLLERRPDGRVVHYRSGAASPGAYTVRLTADGLVWTGHADGLYVWRPLTNDSINPVRSTRVTDCVVRGGTARLPALPGSACRMLAGRPAAERTVSSLHLTMNGSLLVGTQGGTVWHMDSGRVHAMPMSGPSQVNTFAEDRLGNVWIGAANGLFRVARHGLVSWRLDRPFDYDRLRSMGDAGGGVFAASVDGLLLVLARGAVSLVDPIALRDVRPSALVSAAPMRSRRGEWWVPTGQGVFRFPAMPAAALARARPAATYGVRHGIGAAGALLEDRRGDIWVATLGPAGETLVRLEPATGGAQRFGPGQGLPASSVPGVIVETADGDVWIAFREGGLGRIRDGRFEMVQIPGLSPQLLYGLVSGLLVDRGGRLWVGTRTHGAALVDVRGRPTVVRRFDVTSGLSSDFVRPLVEDRNGRVYLGGYHSIDRVDPETGAVRRYSTADGLGSPSVFAAYVDAKGDVWFGTTGGVSQLRAGAEEEDREPPRVRIASLRVAGTPWLTAPLGSVDVRAPDVTGPRSRFEIELIGLGPALDDSLRFQTRLVGGDERWSAPTRQRIVTLASLAAGRYTFEARAMDGRGRTSREPVRVGITVLPPVWQRWWFLVALGGAIVALTYAAHRYRVARLVAMERIRARIATDLHDDIGSGLSQIAVHSEVVRRRLDGDRPSVNRSLAVISQTSTELVDAMNDIVWAINPERDSLTDLTHRMRRFVSDTLTPREIAFTFEAPGDDALSLGADVRRELFLVLKESVNNVARHSGCRSATIRLQRDRRRLTLTVQDDGQGFDPARPVDGNGLASMQRRVAALGGRLAIDSTLGGGTTVRLEVEPR